MPVIVRFVFAWILLIGSLIGWGLSLAGIVAPGEPPFVLSLSWLAIVLTAVGIIETCDVRRKQENDEGE